MARPSADILLTALFALGASFASFCAITFGGPIHAAYTFLFVAGYVLLRFRNRTYRSFLTGMERILGIRIDPYAKHETERALSTVTLLKRRADALLPELIEGTIQGAPELAKALNRVVEAAVRQVGGESSELALFDKTDGRYHSSIVIGRPFRYSIDEYIAGQAKNADMHMHLEPISFAGTVLGALRVGMKTGRPMNDDAKSILRVLALQASVAIVNADFLSELLKMKEFSNASQKARTGFLANLSHELRGPLGIVLNAAELLKDEICGPLTHDQRDTLAMIQKNGTHLLELLNDVLDYAKIESGKIIKEPVAISTREIFFDLAAVVRAQADAKQHKIIVDDHVEGAFLCDRRHIRQILINLLTNAIKYTPDGGTIRIWAEMLRGGKVKLAVRDSGIGIHDQDREKVFNAFERIENAYTRKQNGTGLGMPLTKRLVELNTGTIDFESIPGKGSTFWIIMPGADSVETGSEKSDAAVAVSGGGRAILLVSSDTGESGILSRYLQDRSFAVSVSGGIAEAIQAAKKSSFSVVLIDDSALLEYDRNPISQFREEIAGFSTPVLLVSGEAFAFNVAEQLRAGVDRHLTKPATLNHIASVCLDLAVSDERLVGKAKKANADQIMH